MYTYVTAQMRDGRMKTVAISSFAGKTVRGVAICHPNDTYDEELGKQIATARCNAKVAKKRLNRAVAKKYEAAQKLKEAQLYYNRMRDYYDNAFAAKQDADDAIDSFQYIR